MPVVFLGPGEREWDERIRSELPEAILPLSSDSSPALTIALGRLLGAAVANDSGAGHLLAAAEVPLFLLFGPTPPEKFAPFTPRLTIIRAQNFGGSVMQAIPVDAVDESVSAVL